ncbi:hypothetical protein VNO80_03370 [Phaseolus coccineus]|uniref:Pyruvate carboxyltransferase domain-containing protein n=1 Tax=Phaseolus coccineus TaxID=3886 RepID=A0AAN9NT15_PHACN
MNGSRSRSRPEYIPAHIPDPSYVRILDTTLRDGEQAPGAAMTAEQKLRIARQLAKLGVDVIEAGFPSASQEDFNGVKMIAQEVGSKCDDDGYVPVIVAMCRCNEKDIRTAWEAVKEAQRPRLLPFIATSPIHMEFKLRKTKEEVLQIARHMVAFARSLGVRTKFEYSCVVSLHHQQLKLRFALVVFLFLSWSFLLIQLIVLLAKDPRLRNFECSMFDRDNLLPYAPWICSLFDRCGDWRPAPTNDPELTSSKPTLAPEDSSIHSCLLLYPDNLLPPFCNLFFAHYVFDVHLHIDGTLVD